MLRRQIFRSKREKGSDRKIKNSQVSQFVCFMINQIKQRDMRGYGAHVAELQNEYRISFRKSERNV